MGKRKISKEELSEAQKRLSEAQREIFLAKDKWISKLLDAIAGLMGDKPKTEWPKKVRDAFDYDELTEE